MIPLNVHLLTRNNAATVGAAIRSVSPLATPTVLDLGSSDDTARVAGDAGARVCPAQFPGDRGRSRNAFCGDAPAAWNFYLEPWETLIGGQAEITRVVAASPPGAFHLPVVQGDAYTKQIRLWHKDAGLAFTRPVYEAISDDASGHLNAVIYAGPPPESDKAAALADWKKKYPGASDPHYYAAFNFLERGDWDGFLREAAVYLFREQKNTRPVTMTRYYCGLAQAYHKKNAGEAIRLAMACLAANPLMAEFWCLLGDVHYYLLAQYAKAKSFYSNAVLMGSRRLKTDLWPLQISKYGDYPKEMIASCTGLTRGGVWLAPI